MDEDLKATQDDSFADLLRLRGVAATLNGAGITAVFGEADTELSTNMGGFDEDDITTVLISPSDWAQAHKNRKDRIVSDDVTYVVHKWRKLPQCSFVTLSCKTPEA